MNPPRKSVIAATVAGTAIFGWMLFHPDFHPDAGNVSPAVLAELSKTGVKQTRGIRAVQFETRESIEGESEAGTTEQRILRSGELLTHKRSLRRAKGLAEETVGLYVGPLAVLRFHRTKPPIVGDLLPFHLWSSTQMAKFVVEEVERFPGTKGGKLRAKMTYEDRYAEGELAQSEDRALHCDVTTVVEAASIVPGLSGLAARVECREELLPDGRKVGPANPQTWSAGRVAYAYWYIADHHWWIPSEGEMAIRALGTDATRRWSLKVTSFEREASE